MNAILYLGLAYWPRWLAWLFAPGTIVPSSALCLSSNVVLGFIGNTLKITENFLPVLMWEILTSVKITVFAQTQPKIHGMQQAHVFTQWPNLRCCHCSG